MVGLSLSPEAVVREMLHLMSEMVGLSRGRLVLLDGYERSAEGAIEAQSKARIRFAYGLMRTEMEHGVYAPGEGITGAVLATGQPMIVQDIDQEPRFLCRAVPRSGLPPGSVPFRGWSVRIGGALGGWAGPVGPRPRPGSAAARRVALADRRGSGMAAAGDSGGAAGPAFLPRPGMATPAKHCCARTPGGGAGELGA